ncbi:MAG: serpin family protein [Bacteroidales bacterium]|nr:MAG: serpin family protein [Bacteroidales bacterium]
MRRTKKYTVIITLVLVVWFIIPACEEIPGEQESPKIELTQKSKMLIEADNAFGLELFREIVKDEDGPSNIMVSPLSVSLALAMTYNGSDGTTKEAMEETLHLRGLSVEEINSSYKYLIEALISLDPKVKLDIANSIWYRNDFPVEQDFLDINKEYFSAEVNPLDFTNPASVDIINDWVANNTNEKITKIIELINPLDIMYLINAIYFKGTWTYQFEEENTTELPFYPQEGVSIEVPFMVMEADVLFFSNDMIEAIELTYGRGDYSMIIILPQNEETTSGLIDQFSPENLETWINGFYLREGLTVQLPKFRFEYEKTLNEILSSMGMAVAFSEWEADFSKINPDVQLYISSVKHKTYIDVNEEGTEAAAVTSVTVGATSVGPSNIFSANRPFFFLIRESQSGSIIFSGKVGIPVIEN